MSEQTQQTTTNKPTQKKPIVKINCEICGKEINLVIRYQHLLKAHAQYLKGGFDDDDAEIL